VERNAEPRAAGNRTAASPQHLQLSFELFSQSAATRPAWSTSFHMIETVPPHTFTAIGASRGEVKQTSPLRPGKSREMHCSSVKFSKPTTIATENRSEGRWTIASYRPPSGGMAGSGVISWSGPDRVTEAQRMISSLGFVGLPKGLVEIAIPKLDKLGRPPLPNRGFPVRTAKATNRD